MKRGIETPKSLVEALRLFEDKDAAFEYVKAMRWPNGVACPHCGSLEHSFVSTRKTWQCKGCKKQFSVKVGTIFEESPIGLDKWLCAIWLIVNTKNGCSSCKLARDLEVTQKTAWFMLQRIRAALHNGTIEKLTGHVEADETYIGGKARNMHESAKKALNRKGGGFGKTTVLGMLERDGRVHAQVIKTADRKTLNRLVLKHVDETAKLYTDSHQGYDGLAFHYQHQIIEHATEYVRGNVHTNGIENFWSLLKRTIAGTYVSVEPFHLFRYIDEQVFRFNSRKDNDGQRFQEAVASIVGKRLTYAQLLGREWQTA